MENIVLQESFPVTKMEQEAVAESMVNALIDGEVSPFEAYVKVKALAEICDKFLKDKRVKEEIITEHGKYSKWETPDYQGAKITVKEGGVKYDYTGCNDDVWNDLNAAMNDLKEELKTRETFLQNLPKEGFHMVDPDTGEEKILYRPARTSTTSIAINFVKK